MITKEEVKLLAAKVLNWYFFRRFKNKYVTFYAVSGVGFLGGSSYTNDFFNWLIDFVNANSDLPFNIPQVGTSVNWVLLFLGVFLILISLLVYFCPDPNLMNGQNNDPVNSMSRSPKDLVEENNGIKAKTLNSIAKELNWENSRSELDDSLMFFDDLYESLIQVPRSVRELAGLIADKIVIKVSRFGGIYRLDLPSFRASLSGVSESDAADMIKVLEEARVLYLDQDEETPEFGFFRVQSENVWEWIFEFCIKTKTKPSSIINEIDFSVLD